MITAKEQYCPSCNDFVPQTDDSVCPTCGHMIRRKPSSNGENIHQTHSDVPLEGFTLIWGIGGFLFPILGILAYLLLQESRPISADKAKQGAIIGLIIQIPALIIFLVFTLVAF